MPLDYCIEILSSMFIRVIICDQIIPINIYRQKYTDEFSNNFFNQTS